MVARKTEPPERFFQLLRPIGERQRPWGLEEPLRINTPQALLRDLHRPVGRFEISGFEPMDLGIDRAGMTATRGIKQTFHTDYRIRIFELLDTRKMYREGLDERKSAMGGKWEDAPKLGFGATTSSLMPVFAPSIEDEVAGW